jgi:excisionase family DNA binding protein
MEIQDRINQQIISAVVNMLSPYVTELTPTNLIAALKEHQATQTTAPKLEKPMTRQEVAKMLGVSLLTVSRYLNAGKLRRIQLSGRSVRVDAASFRKLIGCENVEQ